VICYSCMQNGIQKQFKCTHEDYSAGISYVDMNDERYFAPNMKYDGRCCQLCTVVFYPTTGILSYKKVDSKNPAYVCKNHAKGCNHLICHLCKLKRLAVRSPGCPRSRLRSSALCKAK
jgi:hypothetical protein